MIPGRPGRRAPAAHCGVAGVDHADGWSGPREPTVAQRQAGRVDRAAGACSDWRHGDAGRRAAGAGSAGGRHAAGVGAAIGQAGDAQWARGAGGRARQGARDASHPVGRDGRTAAARRRGERNDRASVACGDRDQRGRARRRGGATGSCRGDGVGRAATARRLHEQPRQQRQNEGAQSSSAMRVREGHEVLRYVVSSHGLIDGRAAITCPAASGARRLQRVLSACTRGACLPAPNTCPSAHHEAR